MTENIFSPTSKWICSKINCSNFLTFGEKKKKMKLLMFSFKCVFNAILSVVNVYIAIWSFFPFIFFLFCLKKKIQANFIYTILILIRQNENKKTNLMGKKWGGKFLYLSPIKKDKREMGML